MNDRKIFSVDVQHQPERQCFFTLVDGNKSFVDYRISGDTIDFHHTFVPDAMRGRGIAEQVVNAALAWAKAEDYKIEASCGYVQRFLGA